MAILLVFFLFFTFNLFGQEPTPEKIAAAAKRLEALYPKIPDNENAALVYEEAFKLMKDYKELGIDDEKIPCLCGGFEPSEDILPEAKTKTLRFLDINVDARRKIREGLKLPKARYSLDFSKGIDVSLPPLVSILRMTRILSMETMISEYNSNSEGVLSSFVNSIKFQSSLNNEPFVISYLTQLNCQWMICDDLRWLICRGHLDNDDLSVISKTIQQMDNYQAVKISFQSERVFIEENTKEFLEVEFVSDEQKAQMLKFVDKYISIADQKITQAVQASLAEAKEIKEKGDLIGNSLSCFPSVIIKSAQMTTEVRLLTTALAIERYRLKNEKLPKELKELVPEFLESVPEDPFDGKPVRYKPQEKGYWLYSVGRDLVDNGGTPPEPYGVRPGTDLTLVITR